MLRLARRAMASPAAVRRGLITWFWDQAGECTSPRTLVYWSRPAKAGVKFITVDSKRTKVPLYIDTEVRCRKCTACARARSHHWRMRTLSELAAGGRVWFVTLTMRPVAALRNLDQARLRAHKRGHDLDTASESEIFAARCAVLGAELTKFLKRLRFNSQAQLRYIAVFEPHKSGVPHLHLLIREVAGTLTHRTIRAAWELGFEKSVLVDTETSKAAAYVTKYLSKSMVARVRASLKWGMSSASDPSQNEVWRPSSIAPKRSVQTDS